MFLKLVFCLLGFGVAKAANTLDGSWKKASGPTAFCAEKIQIIKNQEGYELIEEFDSNPNKALYKNEVSITQSQRLMKATAQNKQDKDYNLDTYSKLKIDSGVLQSTSIWNTKEDAGLSSGNKFIYLEKTGKLAYKKILVGIDDKSKLFPESKIDWELPGGKVIATNTASCEYEKSKK